MPDEQNPQDTLSAALADVSKSRAQIEGEVTLLENQLSGLRSVLREVANQEAVLRAVIKSRSGVQVVPVLAADGSEPPKDWGNLSRSWAVREAVAEITRTKAFASPGDVEELFKARNRPDDRDVIGAALSYLRKKGEVIQLGRAQWGIPSDEVNR